MDPVDREAGEGMLQSDSDSDSACYVVSLNYAPVHKTLCFAFGGELQRAARKRVHYLLAGDYKWMLDNTSDVSFLGSSKQAISIARDTVAFGWRWIKVWKLFRRRPPELVYFLNLHPLNSLVALLAKRSDPQCEIIQHVHEPRAYRGVHRFAKNIYYRVAEFFQRIELHVIDHVVVSSAISENAFRKVYPTFRGRMHLAPLLFEDHRVGEDRRRRYLTYVGNVHAARGFFVFLELAAYSRAHNLAFDFQIVTSDNLKPYLSQTEKEVLTRMKIINREHITDEEIGQALRESIACLVLYNYPIMQSGVVPVAYMHGTPIICTGMGGLREAVSDGETGVVVSNSPSPPELVGAANYVKEHLGQMEQSCRARFEATYHAKNWGRYYAWLFS